MNNNRVVTLDNYENFLNYTDGRVEACLNDENLTEGQKIISLCHQIDNYKLIIKDVVDDILEK